MNIAIIGGSGGIGRTFVEVLAGRENVDLIHATYHRNPPQMQHPAVNWHKLDITDEAAIQIWANQIGELDWLINAVGLLHVPQQGPEKSIRQIDPEFFLRNIQTNALPTLLLAKHLQRQTLSIEWQRTVPNVVVAALHPGTTDTALSKPFQKHVPEGQLFPPSKSVNHMLDVLDNLKPEDTGKFWAFDGELLPW